MSTASHFPAKLSRHFAGLSPRGVILRRFETPGSMRDVWPATRRVLQPSYRGSIAESTPSCRGGCLCVSRPGCLFWSLDGCLSSCSYCCALKSEMSKIDTHISSGSRVSFGGRMTPSCPGSELTWSVPCSKWPIVGCCSAKLPVGERSFYLPGFGELLLL